MKVTTRMTARVQKNRILAPIPTTKNQFWKYKRFAKEVVQPTCDGSEGARDVINCITVHPKVLFLEKRTISCNGLFCSSLQ